jgi:hypothetical protein
MTWLGPELDLGMVNHMARLFLGDPIPPLDIGGEGPSWHGLTSDDVVHPSKLGNRRYVWRQAAVEAEPREEISISAEDMAHVEAQLDHYHL